MTYGIVTNDRETRRTVKHQSILARYNHEAVEVAVKRRHRLGQDFWVQVQVDYSTVEEGYQTGTYEVWANGATLPAFAGNYILHRFPDLPKRS